MIVIGPVEETGRVTYISVEIQVEMDGKLCQAFCTVHEYYDPGSESSICDLIQVEPPELRVEVWKYRDTILRAVNPD